MHQRKDHAHTGALLPSLLGLSKTEIVKLAIEERAAKADKSARTRAIFARTMEADAELLDEFST